MTDFYTLFVALAKLLNFKNLPQSKHDSLGKRLIAFGKKIDLRLSDEKAPVNADAVKYVRAVEKGANDKRRRADRQEALLSVISSLFTDKK